MVQNHITYATKHKISFKQVYREKYNINHVM